MARSLLAYAIAEMMGRISQEVVVALRGALHRKLMRLPMAYFDAQQTGRLMARVTSDVGSILMFIRSGILQLLNDLILSVAIAFLLVWLQWRLALVALVAVPLVCPQPASLLWHAAPALGGDPLASFLAVCSSERTSLGRAGGAQLRQGG